MNSSDLYAKLAALEGLASELIQIEEKLTIDRSEYSDSEIKYLEVQEKVTKEIILSELKTLYENDKH